MSQGKELRQDHRNVYTDFKRRSVGLQGVVGFVFLKQPEEIVYKAIRRMVKLQWRPQEIKDSRNMESLPRKVQALRGASHREKPCGLKSVRP